MIDIVTQHLSTYPLMQLEDVAKLIYQSHFGGGHMIADSNKSRAWIQEEYKPSTHPVIEPIGNGMCRMYLSAITQGLSMDVLNEMFVISANNHTGSVESFEDDLQLLMGACQNGHLPFSASELELFLSQWKAKGYPAIHHSKQYRDAYAPSYRVITEDFGKMYDIIQNVMQQSPRTIAIDGMCASGKTTLAELLHLQFPNSTVIHMDDFFLQPHQRTESRLQEVGGNIDYERFYEEIICKLNQSEGFTFRKYNCQNQTLGEPVHVVPRELIIIEGSYSHHPYFGDPYDLRIFCETSAEVQKERILKRNGPNMWLRFQTEWIPMEHAYFDTFHIKHKSGLLQ